MESNQAIRWLLDLQLAVLVPSLHLPSVHPSPPSPESFPCTKSQNRLYAPLTMVNEVTGTCRDRCELGAVLPCRVARRKSVGVPLAVVPCFPRLARRVLPPQPSPRPPAQLAALTPHSFSLRSFGLQIRCRFFLVPKISLLRYIFIPFIYPPCGLLYPSTPSSSSRFGSRLYLEFDRPRTR